MWNIIFLVTGLLFILLLIFIFFSKEVIDSKENRLFKTLMIVNGIEYLLELSLQSLVRNVGIELNSVDVLAKFYLVSIFTWFTLFSIYTFVICLDTKSSKYDKYYRIIRNTNVVLWLIGSVLLIALPFNKFYEADKMFIYGHAVEMLKIILVCYMVVWLLLLFKNIKNIKNKKYAAIFMVLVLGVVNVIIQSVDPSVLITTMIGTFICYIMAFTIENPDLKLLRQMELAKIQAEKSNRAKSDFLSSMSHEIRTPLNAIYGLSEDNLRYESELPPVVVENVHDIMHASETLVEIVGNILDINKIEAEKMELVDGVYNFREEITNMCRITATRIGEKNISFKLNIAEDIPYELIGDKGKVKEIINNLLTNAIKYTEQGEINLNIKCINDYNNKRCNVLVTCQDTGKGIKPELIGRLFTKFDRLDVELNTTTEGTGLGLAITKSLVEMMGGKINVRSQYGKGSIFMVNIPQKISKVTQPMEGVVQEEKQEENSFNSKIKNVLIVDDNILNIKVAARAMDGLGLEIDEAHDALECLEKQKTKKYDLILMDIMMPNMSGEECFLELKKIEGFKTPVIAVTADASASAREKYLHEGFIDYIAKPFNKEQITKKIEEIFK